MGRGGKTRHVGGIKPRAASRGLPTPASSPRVRKVGGVRSVPLGKAAQAVPPLSASGVRGAPPLRARTIGGLKPSVQRVQSCPVNCPGKWIDGSWVHSDWCKAAVVQWKIDGKTLKDWKCDYGCESTEIPSGWTHHWTCEFWNTTNATPF